MRWTGKKLKENEKKERMCKMVSSMAMPKGGIMEPTNLTASGSRIPSIIRPFTKVDMVLLTGPPKSKQAMPPNTAPNTNLEPLCRLLIASVSVT